MTHNPLSPKHPRSLVCGKAHSQGQLVGLTSLGIARKEDHVGRCILLCSDGKVYHFVQSLGINEEIWMVLRSP